MKKIILSLFILFGTVFNTSQAHAQIEPFLGQVAIFGFNFCPRGWTEANGGLISIQQNTALFSLLGTTYGGNGTTTFAVPDLRGKVIIGVGQAPGQPNYVQGDIGGQVNQTLTASNLPAHSHALNAVTGVAGKNSPTGNFLSATGAYRSSGTGTSLAANSVGSTGGNQPFSVRDPYLVMKICIATEGVFPSRP